MLVKALALLLFAGAGLAPLDESGYRTLTARHANQVLLVSFWATWCEPCRAELGELAAMERALPAKTFRLAAVSIDEPEQAREAQQVWSTANFRGPGYIARFADRDTFINSVDAHWSGALPALFVYDRRGKLVKSFTGEVELRKVRSAVREELSR